MAKPKSRNIWGRFLLIWALVLLVVGAIACILLYKYLGVYENTRPELAMDELLASRDAESLIQEAKQNINLGLTEFEDELQLYADYLETVDLEKPLSYRPDQKNSQDDQLIYLVRAGSRSICTVTLTPGDTAPVFGRHFWHVSEIGAASITETLSSVTVHVEALAGQQLYLNSIPLTENHISRENVPIANLSELESRFEPIPTFVEYTVGPLYLEVEITDAEGISIAPDPDSTDDNLYYRPSRPIHRLSVQAPDDMTIVVGGTKLESYDASSSAVGLLDGLGPYTGDAAYRTNMYHFEGLYTVPDVKALGDDGQEVPPVMQSETSYAFFHESEPDAEEEYRPIAERFFNSYLRYTSRAYDASLYYDLLNQILYGSALYEYISTTRDTMIWAGSSTDEGELRYENFHRISPTCFVCTVIYNIDRTSIYWNTQESSTQSGAYEIAFVSTSGRWYAAAMNIIST